MLGGEDEGRDEVVDAECEIVAEVEDGVVPEPVLDADAAIAESVESLLGSVRGTTNADAGADAEGGVNVRGKGVVMGGMGGIGCACAAISVSRFAVSRGQVREMWEARRENVS